LATLGLQLTGGAKTPVKVGAIVTLRPSEQEYILVGVASKRIDIRNGNQAYAAITIASTAVGSHSPSSSFLRVVAARNGMSDPWFSLEPLDHPGFLLNHCGGPLYFCNGPHSEESLFREEATWRIGPSNLPV